MEKVYKTMQRTGACSIAVGVIILVTGVTVGIMSIVCGGLLLKRKGEITFYTEKAKECLHCGHSEQTDYEKIQGAAVSATISGGDCLFACSRVVAGRI